MLNETFNIDAAQDALSGDWAIALRIECDWRTAREYDESRTGVEG